MSTIKFTADGKKVAVIGKLNNQETIVQEIFIVGDAEIPSGENFVVKSLHDAPAISWKEYEIKQVKERNERLLSNLKSENEQYEKQLEDKRKKFQEQAKILSDKFKFIAGAVKNADEGSFNALLAFLEGRIKFLVRNDYFDIVLFTQFVENKSNSDYWPSINLISLFGQDDGSLQFKVFDYYDGYKSSTHVIPFETEEQAIEKLTELMLAKKEYSENIITTAKKYNIQLDTGKVEAYKNSQIQMLLNNIESQNKNIAVNQAKIKQIEELK